MNYKSFTVLFAYFFVLSLNPLSDYPLQSLDNIHLSKVHIQTY